MQAIAESFHNFSFSQTFCSTYSKVVSKERLEKISTVANHVFLHLATALAINTGFYLAFGALFLPPSAHVLTLTCGGALVVVIAIKIAKVAYAHFNPEPSNSPSKVDTSISYAENLAKSIADLSIINTLTAKASNYIHEAGHAIAALACFVEANPKIFVNWSSGLHEYNISYGLTKFGEFIGEETAKLFITAAGLFAPSLFALGEFGIAHCLHENHPFISDALNYHGLSQLLNLGLYGIKAFTIPKMILQHDFIYLWTIGEIHPVIPIILLVGIPLCAFFIFKYLEYKNEHSKRNLLDVGNLSEFHS